MEPLPSPFTQLLSAAFSSSQEFYFLDIGAYRGDFTRSLLSHFSNAKALLFEPTPDNFAFLKSSFQNDSRIQPLKIALSNTLGTQDFYLCQESATNSLLTPNQTTDQIIQVAVSTLDQLSENNQPEIDSDLLHPDKPCHLIKIDTQGNDLNILKGGLNFLRNKQPWVLSEVIFINLYAQQASFDQMIEFFSQSHYALAGIFNLHYTTVGFAGYADFLFIPNSFLQQHPGLTAIPDSFLCLDGDYWMHQAHIFEQACTERLNLIHELSQAASERLQLIERMDAEIQQLRSEITALRGKQV